SYLVNDGGRARQNNASLGNDISSSYDLQATSYVKLDQLFNIFKGGNKIKGGANSSYQDQDPADILKLLRSFIPDQVSVTFGQTKQLINQKVEGRPGFGNFWMAFATKDNLGPSRLYQMGWETDPGLRVPGQPVTDGINLNNSLTFNAFITPIFPNNLKINFTYKTSTGSANLLTYLTDPFGKTGSPTARNEIRIITRPSFFMSSDILNKLVRPDTSTLKAKQITDSFENDIVSFPFPSW